MRRRLRAGLVVAVSAVALGTGAALVAGGALSAGGSAVGGADVRAAASSGVALPTHGVSAAPTSAPASSIEATTGTSPAVSATAAGTQAASSAPVGEGDGKDNAEGLPPTTWPKDYSTPAPAEVKGVDAFLDSAQDAGAPTAGATVEPTDDASIQKRREEIADAASTLYADTAKGAALDELRAEYMENALLGYSTEGDPTVRGEVRAVDLDDTTRRLFVCVDTSAVVIKNEGGTVLQQKVPEGTRTTLNIYDIQTEGERRLVVSHSIAQDPAC